MTPLECPECHAEAATALVRVYYAYDVRGVSRPGRRAIHSKTLLLQGRAEMIESGLDQELRCASCGHCWDVPDDVGLFRFPGGALQDANI